VDEKPENQEGDKNDLSYEKDVPREAGEDIYSYKNIMLTRSRWAWPDSGWKLVGGWAAAIFICIGCSMLAIVMDRGWEGLFEMLGWK
jgi:hypothetical protein